MLDPSTLALLALPLTEPEEIRLRLATTGRRLSSARRTVAESREGYISAVVAQRHSAGA